MIQLPGNATANTVYYHFLHPQIPSDTIFTWHVAGPGGVPSYTTHTNTLTYSFPQQGSYDISVVGNHSAGAFAAQRHLIAEGECEANTCMQYSWQN